MRTVHEILKALIPDTGEYNLLQIQRERVTKHPGSKRPYNFARSKARRKMAARSRHINRGK